VPGRSRVQREQSYDLFAIRRTICEMLLDRKYSLPPEDSDDLTYESFLQRWNGKFNKDLTILASQRDDDEQKIGVFFPQNPPEAKTRKLSVDQGIRQSVCCAAGPRCAFARKSAPHAARTCCARPPLTCPSRAVQSKASSV
jgi:hypothetical protein